MSAITIGSKVRSKVTCQASNLGAFYYEGDIGIVVEKSVPNGRWLLVHWQGQKNKAARGDGLWWAGASDVDLVVDSANVGGHSSIHAGLQKHSVGGCYPLAVVTYGHDPAIHVVENLTTGQVACFPTGIPRQWESAAQAFDFCNRVAEGYPGSDSTNSRIVWVEGRPRYDKTYGGLLIPYEASSFDQGLAKRRLNFAESQEAVRIGRPLTPYEVYQLACDLDNR